jgi:hypothetical protein
MRTRRRHVTGEPARYSFGPRSIAVGKFLLKRRRAGDATVVGFEAVHEAFSGLSFYDFLGGFILADCLEGDDPPLLLTFPHQGEYA